MSAGWEVHAIIDPGSEKEPDLLAALDKLGLAGKWISGADVDALAKIDVIVSGPNPNMRPEVVKGIIEAVRRGVGFFNIDAFGTLSGFTDDIGALLGIRDF